MSQFPSGQWVGFYMYSGHSPRFLTNLPGVSQLPGQLPGPPPLEAETNGVKPQELLAFPRTNMHVHVAELWRFNETLPAILSS